MKHEYYAHSLEGKPPKDWHRLEHHLKAVAEMAEKFASDFGAGDWGYLAELCIAWENAASAPGNALSLQEKNGKEYFEIREAIHVYLHSS